jgi:putative transposase
MLGRAAEQYSINPERRPKGKPKYGGHVERAFRTYMSKVHNDLPGTTFSNVVKKREYDSEGKSVMTLEALETWFTYFIVGVYHQDQHEGNNKIPPIVMWKRGILGDGTSIGRGIPARYKDEEKLRLDFLPFIGRTVQEYGLQFEDIYYWSDALRKFMHAKEPGSFKKKMSFICRYDPRNLSKLWLLDPDSNQYIEVPYRDLSRPPISLWELKLVKKQLRLEAKQSVNEEIIFQTLDKMRHIVETESQKTKSARKLQQRQKNWKKSTEKPSAPKTETYPKSPTVDLYDDFEIKPFGGIRESRK